MSSVSPRRLVFVLLIGFSACVHPTFETPQAQKLYTADQIVLRVNELEQAAITAEANGGLSTDRARLLVSFAVEADKVLAKTPNGWRAMVIQAWMNAKGQIGTIPNLSPFVQAAMDAVDLVLFSSPPSSGTEPTP